VREVSKAPKVVGKTVDKATGGNISKGLKKTGFDKAGQAIIERFSSKSSSKSGTEAIILRRYR
jgi:tRNA A37 threonylcarbamoyltransferase TsaD